ncbi:MAG: hypothetical protein V2I25_17580 [Woeseiaceae bacterium]|jgi:hypothetical protein|nr:hypothetical protein [Woeseiaceae bacterium]
MNLEQYSYLAEILGTATVVVSLIYLAVQVRHGIAQGRAEARYAFVQATSDINMTIAQDKTLASVWRRGLANPDELDADETMQLWMLMGQYCNAWMVMHQLHIDDQLAQNQWQVVINDVAAILCTTGGRAFWRMGRGAFDPEFRTFVDDVLDKGEQPYDMLATS